ncbi:MerR family transcriptional regulator [Lactiplantibacillus mudanjiangensis]|uniref:Putative transcriptional regulator [Lactobacillus brevis ATCC 367] n=1 Tax=Lactiplantibacillus mudanjiangensis TaxID=1296538 RepID=A0A660E6N1_9LACO|nr:MerR family transcriptional regulator [Lactiplantibacillus mudanjiangensis]VDG18603.1 putative transcriptional regulator [Lactobacillus brevis ATCC 367] [Lactiplantibacillus mudanjiangensis]VDG25886.1 putative transcriptional regulator [Lactobacillus brevis ATCC 367] [Lactiplantibacillus mudanjiangensis]VDG28682.1 putative transcriptional regulator [Lactobacillus brevis ATCC 367] [Lactiplantibacillus mudanjiangensis]VDG33720.1 putative transcriptional regulator [Lactobacillus brevis ATCC 367
MLTIRKFAALAGTTRRTLLFYDENELFKPAKVAPNGYRYYDYDQLYQLKFILQLRKLGLSVKDIKHLQAQQQPESLDQQLQQTLAKIQSEITNLTELQTVLTERYEHPQSAIPTMTLTPTIIERPATDFWCSSQSVGCTDDDISQLYQEFYRLINPLKLLNKQESGFLTALKDSSPEHYPEANFRIIKTVSNTKQTTVPIITRPAGRYLVMTASSERVDIMAALAKIQKTVHQQQLKIADNYWQLNLAERLTTKASSNQISIEYQLI